MNYDLHIETIEMNYIKIECGNAPTGFYDLSTMSLGEAVERYFATVLLRI